MKKKDYSLEHEKIVASLTLNVNNILFKNCTLIRSPKTKDYHLCMPSIAYTSAKTNRKSYFPLVKLPATIQAKALLEAIKTYEDLTDE